MEKAQAEAAEAEAAHAEVAQAEVEAELMAWVLMMRAALASLMAPRPAVVAALLALAVYAFDARHWAERRHVGASAGAAPTAETVAALAASNRATVRAMVAAGVGVATVVATIASTPQVEVVGMQAPPWVP